MQDTLDKNNSEKNKKGKKSPSFNIEEKIGIPIEINDPNKKKSRINTDRYEVAIPLTESQIEPLWVSVSEAAKLGGVQTKTIRRAIQANLIEYRVINDRYSIDFGSVVKYFHTSTKLKNKINQEGIGRYIDSWKE